VLCAEAENDSAIAQPLCTLVFSFAVDANAVFVCSPEIERR
jgi:hypothetical protein